MAGYMLSCDFASNLFGQAASGQWLRGKNLLAIEKSKKDTWSCRRDIEATSMDLLLYVFYDFCSMVMVIEGTWG